MLPRVGAEGKSSVPARSPVWRRSLGLALAACALCAGCASREAPGPNLLVICLDTVRLDAFGALDDAGIEDALAPWVDRALRLRGARSTAPWTLPAVASVLTGLYPGQHGAGHFDADVANLDRMLPSPLHRDVATLPALLRDAGFDTVAFVAHPWFNEGFGLQRGFDTLEREPAQEGIVRRATHWLERTAGSGSRPFFMYLHFMEAHHHFQLKPKERTRRIDAMPEALRAAARAAAPEGVCANPRARLCRNFVAYVGAVAELRDAIAALLGALEREGLLDDTLVVLYSDHGEEFHDHAEEQRRRSSDPRGLHGIGHGHTLYGELLQVPLLMWHPRFEGRAVDVPASLIDVAPTALAWLDVEPPSGNVWPGVAVDVLLAPRAGRGERRSLFATGIAYGAEQRTVLREPWKRVAGADPTERLLFDLSVDPGERAPLRRPEIESELDALLDRQARSGPIEPEAVPALDPDELDRLRELGYLRDAE